MRMNQPQVVLLGSEFEQLVAEHNSRLGEGSTQLRTALDPAEREQVAAHLRKCEHMFRKRLGAFPAPIYTTDRAGRITFYNDAAAEFSGRRPQIGADRWCVSWRLYQPDGTPLPHDECPMAIAVKENRPIRGVEAVAERPDGTRVPFAPHPTPLRDASGALVGAVNMLVDISEPEPAWLDGVRVLVVAADIFAAAELDLLIDDAGGVVAATATSAHEVLAILRERRIDAAVVSLPLQDEHAGSVIAALVRREVPFVIHDGQEEHLAQMLGKALLHRRGHR